MSLHACFRTRPPQGDRSPPGRIPKSRPKGCLLALLLLGNWAGTAAALPSSFTGSFALDDDLAIIPFDVASGSIVTLTTFSFGGGVNGANTAIPAGGFAPVVSLFQATGARDLLGSARAGDGSCVGATDAVTGFCWDVQLSAALAVGSYVAVVSQDDNLPLGPGFDDGFSRAGQGNFTGPNFLGSPASFVLPDLNIRDGHWALDIDIQAIAVPLPGSLSLLALGLALLPRARRAN